MATEKIRVAVVGCGAQGKNHLASYRALDDVEIVAICDTDPVRLETVGNEYEVSGRYSDYRDLLEADSYDLVSVCTMPVTHKEIVIGALEQGSHVLCEKPTALNLAEALEMHAAAKRADRLLTVGFNMRFLASTQFLRSFVDQGNLGRPIYTRAWTKATDIPWWGKHYIKRISGGGVLASTAVHILDCALWVAGNPEPVSVSASMTTIFPDKRKDTAPSREAANAFDVEDTISGLIRFADGSWMTLEGGWSWDRPDYSYSFEMIGSNAGICLDPMRIVQERNEIPVDVTSEFLTEPFRESTWAESVAAEIADVVNAIRAGTTPTVRFEEAITVQTIVDAFYTSATMGKEVTLAVDTEQPILS